MSPKRVYRYLSSPVALATIAQWQNYFPITGNFPESTTGSGLTTNASMFYYTEPSYIAYPTTNSSAVIQVGRGYSTFIREAVNPITMVSTGVPNQGTIPFTLTPGASSSTGWNLLGNPYASDIVWATTGWTSSGVGDIISVPENNWDGLGSNRFLVWDRSSNTGTLPGGKIPAGQAFWAHATTSPTLSVTESAKTTQSASNNAGFYRSESDTKDYLFSIKLDNGKNQDYAFVKLTSEGDDNYNTLKDGAKQNNSFFNLSTVSADGVALVFNDLANSFCEKTIPIKLANVQAGNYTLQFDNLDNFSLATIQLVDAFLNTTTTINSSNNQYALTATSDVASFQNRLSLKLARPTLVTNNLVVSEKDSYCQSEENVTLTISTSQPGVTYEAIGSTNGVLSNKVIGNGDNIQLLIPVKNLLLNQNSIRIQSSFAGCSISTILANTKTITVSGIPTITVTSEISGCIGSSLDIVASGSGQTYQWVNNTTNQTLTATSNSISVSLVDLLTSYSVTSISDKGCKGEAKNILVKGESLDIPTITVSNGILETSSTSQFQWLFEGNLIEGANSTQYKPTQSGHYSVRATSTYCTKESSPIEYLVTGIEDTTNGSFAISVYPNPSETGEITITGASSSTSQLQLQITDMLGRELITQPISVEEYKKGVAIDTNLPKGLYIVRVAQNKQSVHQKVVIR